MSNKNLPVWILLFGALLFFSCNKDIDTTIPPPDDFPGFSIPAASPVTGKVTGIVVDENNNPVQNADVVLLGTTYQTDAKGFFHTSNVQLDKYITTVTVSKNGYFKSLRSFSATASRNYLSIKLIPKTLGGTVDAASGGTVSLPNGTTISFPQNGIVVKSTGAAYTGSVKVYATYIDPAASDFAATVPGSMMGKDSSKMYVLQSTGMIAVELESAGGQSLQLATGKTAALKMPIPASLTGKAPSSINTWSLDDRGIWVKEGTATKNGDYYDMQVSHFSFWNCDVPANAIYLTIHVKDQNNNPLPNAVVQLTIPNNNTWWATTYGFTDGTGTVAGLVPANLGLVMNISANIYNCSTPVATQNIGPFSTDTTINVTVTINASQYITVSGTLNNCNGQPVQTGTASLLIGNYNYYTASVVNGSYSISVPFCSSSSTATVWLVDSTTGAYANPVTVQVSGNTVTVPTQVACGTAQNAVFVSNGCQVIGIYNVGIPLNSTNYITVVLNVLVPGAYNITSTLVNGIQFSGSGTLTHTGLDTIYLPGTGNPVNPGTYTVATSTDGGITTFCGAILTVGSNVQPAIFSLGGPGACAGIVIAGNYVVNFPLNQTNFVTLTVNVSSPGTYNISTGAAVNGMSFSGSGVFTTTGVLTVALTAVGTPTTATTSTFIIQANALTGCTFNIISTSTGSAVYTFAGAPGNCSGATIAGTYQTGVPLIGPNTVALQLDVTSAGAFSIMTNTTNGFSFTGSGVFSSIGVQTVLLTGSGTPQAPAANTFIANGGSAQGCVFVVTTN